MTTDPQRPARGLPLTALFLLFAAPLLLGSLLAPWIYGHLLPILAAHFPDTDSLQHPPFERVASRCVMIVAAVLLVPIFRLGGLVPRLKRDIGFRGARLRMLGWGALAGALSIGVLYVAGWWLGAYRPGDKVDSVPGALAAAGGFIVGAALVGFFEEPFFRGFVYGALRTRMSFLGAAVLSSAIFSSLHFMRPRAPEGFDPGTWSSGLALLPHLFGRFELSQDWPFALTLFFMGLTLCRYRERQGHLMFVVGLHAGWVWALQNGVLLLDRNRAIVGYAFGLSDYLSKGPLAVLVMLVFLFWPLRSIQHRDPVPEGGA